MGTRLFDQEILNKEMKGINLFSTTMQGLRPMLLPLPGEPGGAATSSPSDEKMCEVVVAYPL
jgi:hypothetical protein